MPAYMVEITTQCGMCCSRMRFEVYNSKKALLGAFCKKHASEQVERLNRIEKHGEPVPTPALTVPTEGAL